MTSTIIPTSTLAPSPKGAPFIIERIPFDRGVQIEFANMSIDEGKVYDWPMVYILANQSEAYVGQTTCVIQRMGQHGANPEKSQFTSCNIIYNDEFNHSVMDDYEHRLIELMNADGRFKLTNKNDGLTDYNYFGKRQYASMFEELWEQLRTLELADHSIADLEETEVFKYSPFKALNADQRVALGEIFDAINHGLNDGCKPIVVEGMPGTGKTILAIYLLKVLKDDERFSGLNIKLLEPMTALCGTLRRSLKGVANLSPDDIIGPADITKPRYGFRGPTEKAFDILLVDEAHRLKQYKNIVNRFSFKQSCDALDLDYQTANQLDWVLSQARLPIVFYDSLQVVGPSGLSPQIMKASLGGFMQDSIRLESQMRVKGGKSYLDHVLSMLHGAESTFSSNEYEFVLHTSFSDFCEAFNQTLEKHSLTRMVAGFAWKWATKDKSREAYPDLVDITIDDISLRWNCVQDNWVGRGTEDPLVAREVGCIHSIQGYDLSHAYVIIGPDLVLGSDGSIRADRDSYFDKNGKNTVDTIEELTDYLRNIYYVLLTRGIYATHVYICDANLRERLKSYFPVVR